MDLDKTKYFFRIVPFNAEGEQISVIDVLENFSANELDAWLGTVVALADGQHTVQELFDHLGGHYEAGPPESFETTLGSVFDRLLEAEVIRLGDEQVELPEYLAVPFNLQERETAIESMVSDGYITQEHLTKH
ncbi:hypothetical protein [Candidatus Reidiella endopervernicosa]|nr:hypothetical protein [Candidatus Reidiella endopervernicosa]QKQ26638.1 hypothetical protein HUE57_10370 [Candidatus Reidiella endopervernicosa]